MFRNLTEIEINIIQVTQLKIKPCKLCFKICAKNLTNVIIKDNFEMLLGKTRAFTIS